MAYKFFVSSFLAATAAALSMRPCTDGQCSDCEEMDFVVDQGYPKSTIYNSFTMPDYTPSSKSGGYNVWWNVDQPDESCTLMIATPYSQDQSPSDGGIGNIILAVQHAGCYSAPMSGQRFITGFCCGTGDCGSALPIGTRPGSSNQASKGGSNQAVKNLQVQGTLPGAAASQQTQSVTPPSQLAPAKTTASAVSTTLASTKPGATDTDSAYSSTTTTDTTSDSLTTTKGKTKKPNSSNTVYNDDDDSSNGNYKRDNPRCSTSGKPIDDILSCAGPQMDTSGDSSTVVKSYTKAVRQQAVSSLVNCQSGGDSCSIGQISSVEKTQTLTSMKDVTDTTHDGVKVSVHAGISLFGASMGVSTSYDHSFTHTVETQTGSSNTTTVKSTTETKLSVKPGVSAQLWFTGTMNCDLVRTTTSGVTMELEHCTPQSSADGIFLGDTGLITIG